MALYDRRVRVPVGPFVSRLRRHRLAPLFVVLLVSAGTALAQEPRPVAPMVTPVTWAVKVAEESRCGDDGRLLDALTSQIPLAQRASENNAELVATVAVGSERARIVVYDRVLAAEAGSRELPLSSRRCEKVIEAVSLVMGVLVEAGRGALAAAAPPPPPPAALPEEQEPAAPKKPEPAPTKPEVAPLVPAKPNRPPPRARPVWRGPPVGHDLSLAVGTGYGLLPTFAPAMTIGWGIRPSGTWPIWLHATGWLPSVSEDNHASFRAIYGGLMTCPLTFARARVRGRLCPTLAVGGLWGSGQGFEESVDSRRPLVLLGLEFATNVPIVGPLEATLFARVEGVPLRTQFVYRTKDGQEPQIHTPSPVVVSMFGGLVLRFR